MSTFDDRLQTAEQQWQDASPKHLIEHIYLRFHQRHREQLPELKQLAMRVEAVHGDHPEAPVGLTEHLDNLMQELESHMTKEEQILFPLLSRGVYPGGPISVMESEHVQHEGELNRIDELTNISSFFSNQTIIRGPDDRTIKITLALFQICSCEFKAR